jgi:hypothetical protein
MQEQNIQHTIDEGKQLWELVQKYAKLDLVEKLSYVLTVFILGGILFALCTIALYCFCMYLVTALETQTGNLALSYVIVGFALLLVAFLIYWFRVGLISRPLIKSLIKEYFEEKDDSEETTVSETSELEVTEQTEE